MFINYSSYDIIIGPTADDRMFDTLRLFFENNITVEHCLLEWSNKTVLKGNDIARIFGKTGIKLLIDNYKIYHRVDPMYVLQDTLEINNINIDFEKILVN